MSHPALSIQLAVLTALKADSGVQALCGSAPNTRVFDWLQPSTQYPYVQIGDDTFIDGGSHTEQGTEATVTIHSWSQANGKKEVKTLMSSIYDLLHESSLNLSGHDMVLMRQEFQEVLDDPDAITKHGVQRFRVITREA